MLMTPPNHSEIYGSKEEWDHAAEMPGEERCNCTRCGRELEIGEAAYVLGSGTIEQLPIWGDVGFSSSEDGYKQTLCGDCYTELFSPKPNRVALILEQVASKTTTVEVLAERPEELVLIINQEPFGTLIFGGPHGRPIGKLNTVKEEA